MIAIKLTLSVLTAMVTLYLFQIASYTSPYWPPPSLCFITMSVLRKNPGLNSIASMHKDYAAKTRPTSMCPAFSHHAVAR